MSTRESLPLEKSTRCPCDFRLSRPVLNYNPWSEWHVYACLSCGKVECVHPVGDEPRSAGPANGCNFIIELPADFAAWLSLWPRMVAGSPRQSRWMAADTRIHTWEDFERAREALESAQSSMPPVQRLTQFPLPEMPPPALTEPKLARELRFYGLLWEAAQNPDPAVLTDFIWKTSYSE